MYANSQSYIDAGPSIENFNLYDDNPFIGEKRKKFMENILNLFILTMVALDRVGRFLFLFQQKHWAMKPTIWSGKHYVF